jgi:hypothetical protein
VSRRYDMGYDDHEPEPTEDEFDRMTDAEFVQWMREQKQTVHPGFDEAERIEGEQPWNPQPIGLTPEQDDYFRTLAKIDPSPEMGRVIAQAKESLTHQPKDGES